MWPPHKQTHTLKQCKLSFLCASRFLQENRVACEMGLYYIFHIAKLRNKNALQRLLPALGEWKWPQMLIGDQQQLSHTLKTLRKRLRVSEREAWTCLLPSQWTPTMTWPLETSSCTCWRDTSPCCRMSLAQKTFVPSCLTASCSPLSPGEFSHFYSALLETQMQQDNCLSSETF